MGFKRNTLNRWTKQKRRHYCSVLTSLLARTFGSAKQTIPRCLLSGDRYLSPTKTRSPVWRVLSQLPRTQKDLKPSPSRNLTAVPRTQESLHGARKDQAVRTWPSNRRCGSAHRGPCCLFARTRRSETEAPLKQKLERNRGRPRGRGDQERYCTVSGACSYTPTGGSKTEIECDIHL